LSNDQEIEDALDDLEAAVLGGSADLENGAETAVAGTAVEIAAASATRKVLIVQNVGAANMRVGTTGVAATTGVRLVPGGHIIFSSPTAANAVFAIREGATSTTALAQELA
jgi:hypothetical protein